MTFSSHAFNNFILENGVFGFFEQPLKLKSGRISNWYANWRTVSEDAFLLEQLSHYVLDFTRTLVDQKTITVPDCFYGVPEGATKLGIICQYLWAKSSPLYRKGSHVMPMGRSKPKEHGAPKDRYYVGAPRGKTIVIEDVTTTGGSLLETIDKLIEADVDVVAAFGLTHRMELRDDRTPVAEEVAKRNAASGKVRYFPLSNAVELLPLVSARLNPTPELKSSVVREFVEFGEKEISL